MGRITVYTVAEGHSEQGFLTRFLRESLAVLSVDLHVTIIGTGNRKGGFKYRTFDEVCSEICQFLRYTNQPYVTTFFDYYGLPTGDKSGWSFVRDEKQKQADRIVIAAAIEDRLRSGVEERLERKDLARRFIPYIQLHELEALYYSEPHTLANTLGDLTLTPKFEKIVSECGGCEHVNDSLETAPSKRLEKLFPGYKKGRSTMAHAPRLAVNLSLNKVRSACPRFDQWVKRLEALAIPII